MIHYVYMFVANNVIANATTLVPPAATFATDDNTK